MRHVQLLSVATVLSVAIATATSLAAQSIPARWDELTASDWPKAQEKAARTCILPIGILEKHGPHVPIGSDLIQVVGEGDEAGVRGCLPRERETSVLLFLRPDLVQQDRATSESGANQKRWSIPDVYTAIWWYGGFPNHYAGEGDKATRELGEVMTAAPIESLARALKAVKADTQALALQKEFFDRGGK